MNYPEKVREKGEDPSKNVWIIQNDMVEERPFVPWKLMNDFITDAFKGYGVPEEDAKICADVLLESDRRGIESHGCNRFKPIYLDRIKKGTLLPVTKMEIIKEKINKFLESMKMKG